MLNGIAMRGLTLGRTVMRGRTPKGITMREPMVTGIVMRGRTLTEIMRELTVTAIVMRERMQKGMVMRGLVLTGLMLGTLVPRPACIVGARLPVATATFIGLAPFLIPSDTQAQ